MRLIKFRCFLFALVFSASAHAELPFTGVVSYVTDGDTLWVRPRTGEAARKLRLDGIDAPEICQTGGAVARAALQQMVLHQQVVVTIRRNDNYGRGLARIEFAGGDVGAQLVRAGQAWSYRWRRDPGPYAAEEAAARQAHRGLFGDDQPELPRDFRQRHGSCHVG